MSRVLGAELGNLETRIPQTLEMFAPTLKAGKLPLRLPRPRKVLHLGFGAQGLWGA